MDDLKLAVLGKGLGVCREAGSVPTVIPGELTNEVGGGLAGEWSEVLDAVGAVPGAAGGHWLGPADGPAAYGDTALANKFRGRGGQLHRLAG